jgi:hypothetical protein
VSYRSTTFTVTCVWWFDYNLLIQVFEKEYLGFKYFKESFRIQDLPILGS